MPDAPLETALTPVEREALGARVYCDDLIGFAWSPVDESPGPQVRNRMNTRNDAILRALGMLEEQDESHADDLERAELKRLEGKLNLVLELLSELVRERAPGPGQHMVRFSAEGICWRAESPVVPGTCLLTEWYMQPAWPVALRMHVRTLACMPDGDRHLVCARLEGLSDVVRDWLDKLVFRRHRRLVAQKRVTRTADEGGA